MSGLRVRQQRILAFIDDFIRAHGYPPSIRDICRGCEISSTSVVDYNLNILEREGYIRRDPDVSRGIELVDGGRGSERLIRVPMLGRIAAGEPLPVPDAGAQSDPSESIELPTELLRGRDEVYALRVKGTSMVDAMIDDGDLVLLQHASSAENGEMVAVWLKDERETTLKRFYREGDTVRLQPANTTMRPIYVEARNVEVQGRVVGVIRQV